MTENEPSMDEILNSIRNILAEGEAEATDADVAKEQEAQQSAAVSKPSVGQKEASVRAQAAVPEQKQAPVPAADVEISQKEQEEDADDIIDLTDDMIVSRTDEPVTVSVENNDTDSVPSLSEETVENDEQSAVDDDMTVVTSSKPTVTVSHPIEKEYSAMPLEHTMHSSVSSVHTAEDLVSAPAAAAAVASLSHLTQMISAQKQPTTTDGGLTVEALTRELLKPYLKEWLDKNLPAIVEEAVKKEIARIVDRSV